MISVGCMLNFCISMKVILVADNLTLVFVMTDTNPYVLDSELQRLPRSLSESVEALDKDNVLKDLIGEKLLVAIKGIRKVCCNILSQYCSLGF